MLSSTPRQTGLLRSRPPVRIPTICIVDPQADEHQDWKSLAQNNSVRLEVVANTAEALRFSRTAAVDLWVVKTELPGLSGFDLCRMLKAQSSHSVVHLVADQYSPEAERAAWAARATTFTFRAALTICLDQWFLRCKSVFSSTASATIQ